MDSLLKQLLLLDSSTPRIFYKKNWNFQSLQNSINLWHAEYFLKETDFSQSIQKVLEQISSEVAQKNINLDLRKKLTSQKKQLEKLTDDLEKIVVERTFFIEKSHQEESSKLQKERHLIRFIRDLSEQKNFEDLLSLVKKEHRKFIGLGAPFLLIQDHQELQIMSFEGDHLLELKTKANFDFPEYFETENKKISQILANWLGRPFGKSLLLPFPDLKVILLFEHNMNEKSLLSLRDALTEKFLVLNMAIERLLSIHKMNLFSYRWEKTFDVLQDPVAIINIDFDVVRANKNFSSVLYAKKCYETFAGRESPCENCPLPNPEQKSSLIKVKDRAYRLSSFPVQAENSEMMTTFIHQYQDITDSRQLYLKLIQGEKMGALGSLAAHLAHELNNPLTGLASMVQLLMLDPQVGEQLKNDLLEIEKATLRSQLIIKNLIEFVSEEKGEWRPVSLDETIEKTWPLLKTSLRQHNLKLNLQTPKDLVYVEPQLLQQVVFNLMNNALQAMKKPGTLTLSSHLDSKKKTITLQVQDEGEGISSEVQSRLFEPFFTTKAEGLGTGLGLSLSKSIVEKFGGRISYETEIGKGTRFDVTLPLSTAAQTKKVIK